ncbi:MAG: type II toxin-antitoxin system RelE/ParE family toxin [Planctomycetes bacterium]|nr:type II toxin-antitoxin system RelE/ParE family toxin [Planctomycetota bacterium]
MKFNVAFHPSAFEEVEATKRWYLDRNEDAARRFDEELASVVAQIAEDPRIWPERMAGIRQRPTLG